MERGWKPCVEISPNCPRCGSSNTKFCYYNNYSLTQPRYFCKGCRRYWTKGGSLRNVPVGGGCRKNRRSSAKCLRLPITDGHVPSKTTTLSSYGNGNSTGHDSYGNNKVNAQPNTSSSASHIDLALVYANFLNNHQQPTENKSAGFEVPAGDDHQFDIPSLEFATLSNTNNIIMDSSSMQQLPAEENNGIIGCVTSTRPADFSTENLLICNNDNQIYYPGLMESSVHHKHLHQDRVQLQCTVRQETSNYGAVLLPPLPGTTDDHLSSHQELLWSTSTCQFSMNHNAGLQTTQEPVLGPDHDQTQVDPNLLFGNWSPFALSPDHDDTTFTRRT